MKRALGNTAVPSGWRVTSVNECTAEQMFRSHIESGEYGTALQLARTYNLDKDEVYKVHAITLMRNLEVGNNIYVICCR